MHEGQELYTTITIDCDIIFQVNDSRYQIRLIARTEPEPFTRILCPISSSVSCNNCIKNNNNNI